MPAIVHITPSHLTQKQRKGLDFTYFRTQDNGDLLQTKVELGSDIGEHMNTFGDNVRESGRAPVSAFLHPLVSAEDARIIYAAVLAVNKISNTPEFPIPAFPGMT